MAKAKGTTLVSLVHFLASQRERALATLPADVHHYLDETIQPSSWYPEQDLLTLLRGMLALLPGDREKTLAKLGASVAREHLEGVYRHLRTDDTDALARRSVALWGSQHDSGAFAIQMQERGLARFEVRDYALPSPEMCSIFRGYFAETLRISGAVDVVVEKQTCVLQGAESCVWAVTWTESA
jgi:hypothetical protein